SRSIIAIYCRADNRVRHGDQKDRTDRQDCLSYGCMRLNIQRIYAQPCGAPGAIAELRAKLAPSGNIVSEAGRRKTAEVFGAPLSPAEVVERICSDVRTEGLSAVLRYTAKLDGAELTAETLRVPANELA